MLSCWLRLYDSAGRFDDPISLLENGRPQWRSGPPVCLWLALSYALAGRKERAAIGFAVARIQHLRELIVLRIAPGRV
jgi:hypothetical protein